MVIHTKYTGAARSTRGTSLLGLLLLGLLLYLPSTCAYVVHGDYIMHQHDHCSAIFCISMLSTSSSPLSSSMSSWS